MSSIMQKLRDSIDKLNQIDVGREFAKLKDINVEDLRNISLSDLRGKADPMVLSVVGSIVFVGAGLYCFTLPEWRSWGLNSQILQQYRSEADELSLLKSTLNNLKKQQEEIGEDFDMFAILFQRNQLSCSHLSFSVRQRSVPVFGCLV